MMASPEHIDNHKPENQQAPSPAEEKQVPTVVENKRAWLKPLMRVVGVVVPLMGGFAIMCLTLYNLDFQGWGLLVAFLLGIVGALLFRSWWAILVVPSALTLGELLVVYLVPFLFIPNPIEVDDVGFDVFISVSATPIIGLLGVLMGTAIVKKT